MVIGTRPEAIKLLPLVEHLRTNWAETIEVQIVSTGQHREMLEQVLAVFQMQADHELGLMRPDQTPTDLAARALEAFGPLVHQLQPHAVVVQGDTTTAFACGLASYLSGHPTLVGHVEAGLRTADRRSPFPEEMNRRLLGSVADLHFAPTPLARDNLLAEGLPSSAVLVTGNTVIDALLAVTARPAPKDLESRLGGLSLKSDRRIVLVTLHRRESFGEAHARAFAALRRVATAHPTDVDIIYPVHLNPQVRNPALAALADLPNVHLVEPLPYDSFVHLLKQSWVVLTDSGGIQEEAPSLRVPVLVARDMTERPEAQAVGASRVLGTNEEAMVTALEELLSNEQARNAMRPGRNPYGDGKACERITLCLLRALGLDAPEPQPFVFPEAP